MQRTSLCICVLAWIAKGDCGITLAMAGMNRGADSFAYASDFNRGSPNSTLVTGRPG